MSAPDFEHILLDIDEGWHVQAGQGSGDDVPPYLATEVELLLPDGWTAGDAMWPEAHSFQLGTGSFAETLRGYEGRTLVIVPVEIPADLAEGRHDAAAAMLREAFARGARDAGVLENAVGLSGEAHEQRARRHRPQPGQDVGGSLQFEPF